jgi:cell wall integrity and stress response component
LIRRHRKNGPGNSSSGSAVISAGGAGFFGRQRSRSISTLGLIGEKAALARNSSPTDTQNCPSSSTNSAGDAGQVYDQRLDPTQVYLRFDPRTGSSRMSVRSLRDDQDYSRRVLRVSFFFFFCPCLLVTNMIGIVGKS